MSDQQLDQHELQQEENKLIAQRKEKLAAVREQGNAFPNDFRRDSLCADLQKQYAEKTKEELEAAAIPVKVAGRIMLNRGAFMVIQDTSGRLQVYVNRKTLPAEQLEAVKHFDLGDIIAAEGTLARSGKGDLYVDMLNVRLLTKSLRPLPDKHHGLTDTEQRYRQRYVDLIVNEEVRDTFRVRSQVIAHIRRFLNERGFLEVETPMLQTIPGGAAAKPFETHHNALDMPMFLRIAPELYLKRLVVGGFEKVFEINRNFRNEGADSTHSPEFAMLETYQAYGTYDDGAELIRSLVQTVAQKALGTLTPAMPDGSTYDLSGEWTSLSMYPSLSEALGREIVPQHDVDGVAQGTTVDELLKIADDVGLAVPLDKGYGHGKLVEELWEHLVGSKLDEPVFVRDFPVETSPLVRAHRSIPGVVEKWDLYVRGFELATGYSELVDPIIQRERFVDQARLAAAGDDEAMVLDEEFLAAMEHGMPPTSGTGMGIDRLLMALTGLGIRETVLFPLVKPRVD